MKLNGENKEDNIVPLSCHVVEEVQYKPQN